jgi:nitrogen fixation NifU-like protein
MSDFEAYTKKVMELFKNPKYVGELKDADGIGIDGNPICGDVMKVFIKVGKDKDGKEIIKDIRYQTFGCVAAISSTEALARIAKGKTLEDALKITKDDVADYLGSLPKIKFHCSILGIQTLHKAIKDYQGKK